MNVLKFVRVLKTKRAFVFYNQYHVCTMLIMIFVATFIGVKPT